MSGIDDAFQFNQVALSLRAARQELIASNIANADTPNYKARDINFSAALQGALSGSAGKLPLSTSAPNHLSGKEASGPIDTQVMYRNPTQPSADGNTVDANAERAQFADNALRYEASLQFVNNKIKEYLAALQP
jgi:flagellar basal-body rod protein FlgB